MHANERLPVQRAAKIVYHLMNGEPLTTVQVAVMLGMSRRNAFRVLCLISEELPIYQERGVWRICQQREG